jgi:vacuolar-type H+-ATPase subunit H
LTAAGAAARPLVVTLVPSAGNVTPRSNDGTVGVRHPLSERSARSVGRRYLGVYALDEDSRLEDIREREELIASDSRAPLHLIRQKEIELSGRVLSAREDAAEIVAKARHESFEIIAQTEADAEIEAKAYEAGRMEQARIDVDVLRGTVGAQVEAMRDSVRERHAAAVEAVVERVLRV